MAAQDRSLLVQLALIFFFCTTVVLGVGWFMQYRYSGDVEGQRKAADTEAGDAKSALRQKLDEIEGLKGLIGHTYTDVGVTDPSNPNTVMGAMNEDIRKFGKELQESTYTATLAKLRSQVDNLTGQNAEMQTTVARHQATIEALQAEYREQVVEQEQRAAAAEQNREEIQASKAAAVDEIQQDLDAALVSKRAAENQVNAAAERFELARREYEQAQNALVQINDELNQKLDDAIDVSFEVADGMVTRVDPVTNLIFIDVGEADQLREGTTFSIYEKDYQNVGGTPEDIKGAIEVTRIYGNHLAAATIVEDDIRRPISPGDSIYTPLWSPGQRLNFSLAGYIDLDGDGASDRPLLHDLIAGANGSVDNEILDTGEVVGEGIDVHTKWLVIGELPDGSETDRIQDDEAVAAILRETLAMKDAARQVGVRWVSLSDFLAYMGYKPSRRVWRPGEDAPWIVERGGRRQPPSSSGTTSGLYQGRRIRRPATSETIQTFGRDN